MRAKIGGVGGVGRRDRGAGGAKKKKNEEERTKKSPLLCSRGEKNDKYVGFPEKEEEQKRHFFRCFTSHSSKRQNSERLFLGDTIVRGVKKENNGKRMVEDEDDVFLFYLSIQPSKSERQKK